jgi:amino acid transporter
MKHVLSFVGWLLRKWFVSNDGWYRKYERAVVDEPVIMIPGTVMIYGVFWVLSLVPLAVINPDFNTIYITWLVMAVVVFGNYFRILLMVQYRLYQREQQHIIDRLKREH